MVIFSLLRWQAVEQPSSLVTFFFISISRKWVSLNFFLSFCISLCIYLPFFLFVFHLSSCLTHFPSLYFNISPCLTPLLLGSSFIHFISLYWLLSFSRYTFWPFNPPLFFFFCHQTRMMSLSSFWARLQCRQRLFNILGIGSPSPKNTLSVH